MRDGTRIGNAVYRKVSKGEGMSRRDALKTAAAATAGLVVSPRSVFAGGQSDTIRVGVIGCGGRGTGAAVNCVESSRGIEIVALGDLFPDRLASPGAAAEKLGAAFKATDDSCFIGFDAYQKVLAQRRRPGDPRHAAALPARCTSSAAIDGGQARVHGEAGRRRRPPASAR